jgi:hypothetical protein
MTIEGALLQRIKAFGDVADIAGDRVFPVLLPERVRFPAVTYQRITTVRDYTTTGPVALDRVRMQYDVWAMTYPECKALQRAIVAAIEGAGDGDPIDSVRLDTAFDGYESEARVYRVSLDFIVFGLE